MHFSFHAQQWALCVHVKIVYVLQLLGDSVISMNLGFLGELFKFSILGGGALSHLTVSAKLFFSLILSGSALWPWRFHREVHSQPTVVTFYCW